MSAINPCTKISYPPPPPQHLQHIIIDTHETNDLMHPHPQLHEHGQEHEHVHVHGHVHFGLRTLIRQQQLVVKVVVVAVEVLEGFVFLGF